MKVILNYARTCNVAQLHIWYSKSCEGTHRFPLVLSRHCTVRPMPKHIHHLGDWTPAAITVRPCTWSSLYVTT